MNKYNLEKNINILENNIIEINNYLNKLKNDKQYLSSQKIASNLYKNRKINDKTSFYQNNNNYINWNIGLYNPFNLIKKIISKL